MMLARLPLLLLRVPSRITAPLRRSGTALNSATMASASASTSASTSASGAASPSPAPAPAAVRPALWRFNQGVRVTIEGFSKHSGDAVIRKVNPDGTLRIKYADGTTYSATDPNLATLFVDLSGKDRAGGRHREGSKLPPGVSRYDSGHGKRKMNLTVAFVGTEFQGMQLQSDKDASWEDQPPTVEHRLMGALGAWGGIIAANMGDLSKNGWTRSSRTDKGVSAIGCSVACKLVVPLEDLIENGGHFTEEILTKINTHLPPTVRVVDGFRVAKGFSAQKSADARRYFLPVSALRGASLEEFQSVLRQFEGVMHVHNFMGQKGVPAEGGSGRKKGGTAKVDDPGQLLMAAALECITSAESGGHSWPYFKEGQRHDDRMRREIYSVQATPLDMSELGAGATAPSEEWIQIRKMIGASLYILWGDEYLPKKAFEVALKGIWRLPTPLVPGEFLMLEETSWRPGTTSGQYVPGQDCPKPEGGAASSTHPVAIASQTDGRDDQAAQERALSAADEKLQAFKSDLILPEIFSHAPLWEEWMTNQMGTIRWEDVVDSETGKATGEMTSHVVGEEEWALLLAADAALETELEAKGYADAIITTKKHKGVVQPRGLSLQLATHFRLTPGPELTALTKRAGAAIIDGEVGGEDVADVIAYLEREGAAPEGGSGSGGE